MEDKLQSFSLFPQSSNGEDSGYAPPELDCGDSNGTWHRLRVRFTAQAGARLTISLYTSNDRKIPRAPVLACENASDLLLHGVIGRYLWIRLRYDGDVSVEHIHVSYPAQSLVYYLPEIYQAQPLRDSFTDHYLSLFQSLYDDMEEMIDHSSSLYDVDACPQEFVSWLGSWLAFDQLTLWPAERLRAVLRMVPELYRRRGTLYGISMLLKAYCETDYYFIETYHAARYYSVCPELIPLYSRDRFSFWILVNGAVKGGQEEALRHLLAANKPAFTRARLLLLEPSLILGGYCYLGINSILSGVRPGSLDGKSALNHMFLEG